MTRSPVSGRKDPQRRLSLSKEKCSCFGNPSRSWPFRQQEILGSLLPLAQDRHTLPGMTPSVLRALGEVSLNRHVDLPFLPGRVSL
jgi:hypothetical protein